MGFPRWYFCDAIILSSNVFQVSLRGNYSFISEIELYPIYEIPKGIMHSIICIFFRIFL